MWNPFRKEKLVAQRDQIVTTRERFAQNLHRALYERAAAFRRREWQPASVVVPEEWDALFETSAWANTLATCCTVISKSRLGPDEGMKLCLALAKSFADLDPDGAFSFVSSLAVKMVRVKPLPPGDAVFRVGVCRQLAMHGLAFARANAAIETVRLEEGQRHDVLCRLGQCLVFNTHNATLWFGPLAERLRFVDTDEEMIRAVDT